MSQEAPVIKIQNETMEATFTSRRSEGEEEAERNLK